MKYAKLRLTAVIGAVSLMFCTYAMGDDNRYIIQFAPGQAGQGVAAVKAMGGDIKVDLTNRSVNAVAVTLPEQAIQGLQNNPNVLNIEEDTRVYPMAETVPYGISMVQADQVSDANAGGINVCIIDSGYHAGHFDLQANPVNGLNLSGSGDPFVDSCGHGTHVAGTVAAVNNGDGVIGVMPGANINLTIAKVFGDDNWTSGSCGWSYSSGVIEAAYACRDAGADVINMSLGGSGASSTAEQGFQDLLDQGVLSIAAAGNDGTTGYSYPASYPAVVSVAAIDDTKTVADFSQKNDQVELAAPGVGVLSTVPTISATAEVNGTSYTVSALDGSASATASGGLVDGGLCDSAGNWSGNVVLCERGSISFGDKVANVEAGGGAAAIIYNNVSGGFLGLIECNGPSWRACSAIPAVSMSQSDGQYLVGNELGSSATVSTEASAPADGYDSYNGTSMASPHVAGVAALVWSQVPTASAADIRAALVATAEDLGSGGRDNSYGYGLIQAADAVAYLGGGGGGTNAAPSASFSYSCTELACDFDGSGSSDSDGTIASYSWTFGDSNTASGSTTSHTYAGDGSYTVTLTVTDDAGATDSTSQTVTVQSADTGGGDISLSANGYKNKGRWTTDLSWSGASSNNVDIYRDGAVLTTVSNSGSYTDATDFRGGGSLTYQVCEAGTSTCSDTVTVTF